MRDRPVILAGLVLLMALLTAPFWHGLMARTGGASPRIPAAEGRHCVRPAAWMRRYHMKLLMQVRYEAVHEGIRNRQESLRGCMSCHVSKMADGRYPSVTSRKFFCNACHEYVGVRIDCFSCHSNRPDSGSGTVARSGVEAFLASPAAIRHLAVAPPWPVANVPSAALPGRAPSWRSP